MADQSPKRFVNSVKILPLLTLPTTFEALDTRFFSLVPDAEMLYRIIRALLLMPRRRGGFSACGLSYLDRLIFRTAVRAVSLYCI